MTGTSAQGDAADYLYHVTFQGMIIDCMAAQGFTYVGVPAFRVPYPTARYGGGVLDPVAPTAFEADGLGLDAAVAGLVENAKAGEPIVRDTGDADAPRLPEHEVSGWSGAIDGCLPTDQEVNERVRRPSFDRGLPLSDLVDGILESEPVRSAVAEYPECMRDAGWPVTDRHELVWQVRGGFETLLVDASRAFSEDPMERAADVDELIDSNEWGRVVDTRAQAASADAACRLEAHDLAFEAMLVPLRDFAAENRAEIEELQADWAALEERASETPDPSS